MCVSFLMVPEFVWEAGTFRAALPASASEDICITIPLLTFLCGHAYSVIITRAHTHTHTYLMGRTRRAQSFSLICIVISLYTHAHMPQAYKQVFILLPYIHVFTYFRMWAFWCMCELRPNISTMDSAAQNLSSPTFFIYTCQQQGSAPTFIVLTFNFPSTLEVGMCCVV